MANSELYRPIKSVQIEGFTHSEVQGTPVPSKGIPFKDEHIPQFSVVGIETIEDGKGDNNSTLRKISSIHRRSYEFVTGKESKIVWSDEFGNIFTALNTKGNNVTDPEVCKYSEAPSGFLFFGLQDSDTMVRILKASELLRSRNIDTEAIIKVIEPAEFPYNGDMLSLAEYKRKLVQRVWDENARDGKMSARVTNLELATRQDIPRLSQSLDKMTFFETIRGTQVNERIADLTKAANLQEALPMLSNAFRYINLIEKINASKDPSYQPQSFSINREEDIIRYFNEYLPKRTAHNFAGAHRAGVVFKYSHTGNISTVGSIYDLDSVQGEPLGLGDGNITSEDVVDDIKGFIDGSSGMPGAIKVAEKFAGERTEFKENFLKDYIKKMGFEGNLICFNYIIGPLYDYFQDGHDFDKEDYYMDQIVKKIGFTYTVDSHELLGVIKREIDSWEDEEKKNYALQVLSLFILTTQNLVNVGVRKQHLKVNPEDVIGPSDAELFSRVFTIRETARVDPLQDLSLGDTLEDASGTLKDVQNKYKFPIYQKLIQHWGWEEDIIPHVAEIDYLFDGFYTPETYEKFDYYHTKLLEQLGWDFVMEETLDEMIETFHFLEQERARIQIEKALEKVAENEDRQKIVDNILSSEYGSQYELSPKARYNAFVLGYVDGRFEDLHAEDIKQLEEKYDPLTTTIISSWLKAKYENKFIDDIPDETAEEIENTAKARIEELKQEYLSVTLQKPPSPR